MPLLNILLLSLNYRLSYISGFTQYDEDGYPIEETQWDNEEDDGDLLEEDDFDTEIEETEWE